MNKYASRLIQVMFAGAALALCGSGCKKPTPTMTLIGAIQSDNASQVEANLRAGADMNNRDDAGLPLIVLGAGRSRDVLKAMLDHKPSLNVIDERTGISALHAAAMKFDGSANVQLLLKAGADVNPHDKQGRTPLFRAAESGDVESLKALIDAGADVNAADQQGRTPLDIAEVHFDTAKDPGVVEYLKSKGAKKGIVPASQSNGR
jgi:ankyrin repeat protein